MADYFSVYVYGESRFYFLLIWKDGSQQKYFLVFTQRSLFLYLGFVKFMHLSSMD